MIEFFDEAVQTAVQNVTSTGTDEWGNQLTFMAGEDNNTFTLRDVARNITVKDLTNDSNSWNEEEHRQAVSAYTNMQKVYDWYLNNLQVRSFDGNGKEIKINVHDKGSTDNAMYVFGPNQFYFGDFDKIPSTLTFASQLDVVGHEFTHAVVRYYADYPIFETDSSSMLNESFADVFGCFIDGDWIHSEDIEVSSYSAISPEAYGQPSELNGLFFIDLTSKNFDEHNNRSILPHIAYSYVTVSVRCGIVQDLVRSLENGDQPQF
jgi:Zn-dependent metalloprotease